MDVSVNLRDLCVVFSVLYNEIKQFRVPVLTEPPPLLTQMY